MAVMEIDISTDRAAMRRVQRALSAIKRGAPRAIHSATRTTLRNIRTVVVRSTAKDIGVPQKAVFRRGSRSNPIQEIAYREQGRWITSGEVVAESVRGEEGQAKGSGRGRIRLGRLNPRDLKRGGVSYRLGGESRRISDAFLIEKGGFRGVFRREHGRMFQLHGPSVAHAAQNRPEVRKLVNGQAAQLYEKNINSQLDRFLKKARGG